MRRAWLLVLIAGCSAPEPSPIDPVKSEADFRARSLSDPGLKAGAEAQRASRASPEEAPAFPPDTWDLESLVLVALYYHPDIDVARARVEKAAAGEITAGAWPNPTLGAGLDYNFDIARGVSPWTYTFDLSLPVELGGKRRYRKEEARQLTEAARLELGEAAWDAHARVRDALVAHLLSLREVELREIEESARDSLAGMLEKRLAAGAVSRREADPARLEANAARMALLAARGRVGTSLAVLASALGLPVSALAGARFSQGGLERSPTEAELSLAAVRGTGLLNRLDLRRSLAEHAAAEAALRREVAKQYPDINLDPGFQREEGDNKLLFGVSLPLPIFDQNQGPIAEAVARRDEAGARFLALQAKALGEIEGVLAGYRSAVEELEEAERIASGYEKSESATLRAVEAGEEDLLDLARARVQTAIARLENLKALERVKALLAALEDALQRPIEESRRRDDGT